MGASGVAIFDDDLAADVRDLFRELLEQGETGPGATRFLIEHFGEVIGTNEESVFWLALAAVQWEYGLLQQRILKRALNIIASDSDLERWKHSAKLRRGREEVLHRLRDKLNSPRANPKTVRRKKRIPPSCDWQKGDVFSYTVPSGNMLLMRVVAVLRFGLQERALCELLDWVGNDVPETRRISELPIRRNKRYPSESTFCFPLAKKHLSRCRLLGIQLPPVMPNDGSYVLPLDFKNLESELDEHFGLSIHNFSPQTAT